MRWPALAFVATCLALLAAQAATAQVSQNFGQLRAWYESLIWEDRVSLQRDLILTGNYDGVIDGQYGPGTFRALEEFQASIGSTSRDGLKPWERFRLAEEAEKEFSRLGFTLIDNEDLGLQTYLPVRVLAFVGDTKLGRMYANEQQTLTLEFLDIDASELPFETLFALSSQSGSGQVVTYKAYNSGRFAVAGASSGQYFYRWFTNAGTSSIGFEVRYAESARLDGTKIAIFLASNTGPASQGVEVAALPEPPAVSPVAEGDVPQKTSISFGSGFYFAPRGMLVTNAHVVEECEAVHITGYGPARVLKEDSDVDLAVLQLVDQTRTHFWAPIRENAPRLGETVVLMGYPLAPLLGSDISVSTGIVSSESAGGVEGWFSTNAGIQVGNSGGPILDETGSVIGVAVAKLDDAYLYEQTGSLGSNIGFAIRNDVLVEFVSIFSRPAQGSAARKPRSVVDIASAARNYTAQIICGEAETIAELGQQAVEMHGESSSEAPDMDSPETVSHVSDANEAPAEPSADEPVVLQPGSNVDYTPPPVNQPLDGTNVNRPFFTPLN
jgi:S1-C subfamily serine protease